MEDWRDEDEKIYLHGASLAVSSQRGFTLNAN